MTRERLDMETRVLEKYFPRRFRFVNMDRDGGYLEVGMKTQSGTVYQLKIEMENDYPNSMPAVYISYPTNLEDHNGSSMLSVSAAMHTLSSKDGYTQICTTWAEKWNPKRSLFQVIMKARIWLEAFEGHKKTGKTLDHYLSEN